MEFVNATSQIYSCISKYGKCDIYNSIVFIPANIASIIINLFHLLVLRNMHGLKELNYFWILLNLTLGDIGISIAITLSVICEIWNSDNCIITILAYGFIGCTVQVRYWLLTLGVLDRYYAVCKPFKYKTSKFINNVGKLAAAAWTLNALFAMTDAFITRSCPCLDSVADSVYAWILDIAIYVDVAIVLNTVVPTVTSTVLLVKILAEVRRMKQRRSTTTKYDQETRSATRYTIGIFIMLYLSSMPTIAYVVLYMINSRYKTDFSWLVSLGMLGQLLYGIGNVVLYGVLNKAYVTKIKSICQPLCPVVKVSPQVNT